MRFLLCTLLAALLLPLSARSEVLDEIHSQYRDGLIWLKVDVTGKSEPLNFLRVPGATKAHSKVMILTGRCATGKDILRCGFRVGA